MLNLNVPDAVAFLMSADIAQVESWHARAAAKMASLDLSLLGIASVSNGFKFQPFKVTVPHAGAQPNGNSRAYFDWVDEIEMVTVGDPPNVRKAKLKSIDNLGRLVATAASRLALELPAELPNLAEMDAQEKPVGEAVSAEEVPAEGAPVEEASTESPAEPQSEQGEQGPGDQVNPTGDGSATEGGAGAGALEGAAANTDPASNPASNPPADGQSPAPDSPVEVVTASKGAKGSPKK